MFDYLCEEATNISTVLQRDPALELIFDCVDQYFLFEVFLQSVYVELYLLLLTAVVRKIEGKSVEDAAFDSGIEEAAINSIQLCP